MARIINSTFVSLDGVINHMEAWHFSYVDDESGEVALEHMRPCEAILMGRGTYEVYAAAWPERDGELADKLNSMRKYVASTTLDKADWNNTTIISSDLVGEVTKLKEQPGDILMHGFGPVAHTLLNEGMLDELHLWIHPAFAGVGTTDDMLFTEGTNRHLTLTATRPLSSGIVILTYQAT